MQQKTLVTLLFFEEVTFSFFCHLPADDFQLIETKI